ncbi:hypothetical protein L195_g016404, partial [Trifolium pratense]
MVDVGTTLADGWAGRTGMEELEVVDVQLNEDGWSVEQFVHRMGGLYLQALRCLSQQENERDT